MKISGLKAMISADFEKEKADKIFVQLKDKYYNMTCQNHQCNQFEKKIVKKNFNIQNWIAPKENTLILQLTDNLCCKEFEWKLQQDFVKDLKDNGGKPKIKPS